MFTHVENKNHVFFGLCCSMQVSGALLAITRTRSVMDLLLFQTGIERVRGLVYGIMPHIAPVCGVITSGRWIYLAE